MTGGAALVGALAKKQAQGIALSLGTVTSVGGTTVDVLLDGAETDVEAVNGAAAAAINDRVIVAPIGRTLYVLVNLTTV